MRDDRLRLEDIREAIDQIEKYAGRGRLAFESDELIRVWVLHHLEIIGEACRGLSVEFRKAHLDEYSLKENFHRFSFRRRGRTDKQ